uniref:Uncharacterized protein n=1 Tax=viral metagenome TaxID=1070528 RepID=A0A6C0BV10_9ZZZZ
MKKNNYLKISIILLFLLSLICFSCFFKTYTYNIPKTIWIYWDNYNNLPNSIDNIIKYNKKTIKTWKIIYLSDENINEYIPQDEFPKNINNIIVQAKSDWFRLYLLNKYGGLWLDASIIVNNEEKLNELVKESFLNNSDLTSYYLNSRIVNDQHFTHIETSFLLSPLNSYFVERWKKEFEYAIEIGFKNYKNLLLSQGYNLEKIFNGGDDDVYLMIHACAYKVGSEYIFNPNVLLYKAEDEIYYLQETCGWENKCISDKLNKDSSVKSIPLIKLVNKNRENLNLDDFIKL